MEVNMNPFDSDTLRLILIFFVPGFISMKVYDLYVPSERRDFSKSLMEAVSFSCVNFAAMYWAIVAIHADNFPTNHPFWYYLASAGILFVAPIFWPILYSRTMSLPFFRKRTIHPTPKPWDYVFSKGESLWVIVHLRDGRRIGGRFDTQSFASSFPADEQIYIEEVWQLDSKGRFKRKVDDSRGLIISREDFEAIEFFQQS
jgi:hypothetical protein